MPVRRDPPRRASIAAISAVLAALVASRPAHAQRAEAEALFNDGNRLMTEHQLAQACEAFEASNRIEPGAGTLIRLGDCREQNQQLASAWSAYRDALSRVKDRRKRDYAAAHASALEPRLSYFTISVSADSKLDGLTITRNDKPLDPMLWNRALPVDGGDYVIVARAPGHDDWRATTSIPLERGNVTLEVPRLHEPIAPPPPPPPPPELRPTSTTAAPPVEPIPPHTLFTGRRKIALGVGGASVIAVVTGAVLGSSARSKQDAAFRLCADPATPCDAADESNALIQAGHRRALEANIAFGVAAAAAIGAGVLWFTGGSTTEAPPRMSIVPTASSSTTGLAVIGRF